MSTASALAGRSVAIDADLPARLGDGELRAPSSADVAALCARGLALEPVGEPVCVHARWKRGVSLATCWSLRDASGAARLVVHKRYVGDKAAHVATRAPGEGGVLQLDSHSLLWKAEEDRELPGLARILDRHRTTRLLHRLGSLSPWVARWASSSVEIVRYKPEHRAVARLDLDLRFEHKGGAKSRRPLAARVLRPDRAARVLELRRGLDQLAPPNSFAPWPRLRGAEPRTGLMFETWIEGRAFARDEFGHAAAVGRLLAKLHALPVSAAPASQATEAHDSESSASRDVLGAEPALAALARRVPAPQARVIAWTHGDLHPDQVLVADEDGTARLLDLDNLAPGDPLADLASWIADRLARADAPRFDEAAAPLLEGYARAVDARRLHAQVAWALAGLAAGALRRLEPGALERARTLLERAASIAATKETGS